MTAASATAGCAITAFSRSTEEIHSPPDLMMSLDRSVSRRNPSGVMLPTSPVRGHPRPGHLELADALAVPRQLGAAIVDQPGPHRRREAALQDPVLPGLLWAE